MRLTERDLASRRQGDPGNLGLAGDLRAGRAMTGQRACPLATLLLCVSLLGCLASEPPSTPAWDSTSERLLASAHSSFMLEEFLRVSMDSKRVAFAISKDNRTAIALNGRVGKFYKYVNGPLQFSRNSKVLAYMAKTDRGPAVVVNEKEIDFPIIEGIPHRDEDTINRFLLSSDGKSIAFEVHFGEESYAVKDNVLLVSGGKVGVVVDGKLQKKYGDVGPTSLTFSPNSRRFAYATGMSNSTFTVVDGNEGKHYPGIGSNSLSFSPNSQKFAFVGMTTNRQFVVVDGQEGKPYDGVHEGGPSFSPDSTHFAYGATLGKKHLIVMDRSEYEEYDGVSAITFSPNSKRLAYGASISNRWFVIVDSHRSRDLDGFGSIAFSPDSKRVAYAAWLGGKWCVVVDGNVGKLYDGIGKDSLHFSFNSRHLAYTARWGTNWCVVLDERELPAHEGILEGTPIFSPDGRHIAYGAQEGDWVRMVVDAKAGPPHNRIFGDFYGGKIIFDSMGSLHYIALTGDNIYLVHRRFNSALYYGL